jgi:hypothetical protein
MGDTEIAVGLMKQALARLDRAGNQHCAAGHLQMAIDLVAGVPPLSKDDVVSVEDELRLEALLDRTPRTH